MVNIDVEQTKTKVFKGEAFAYRMSDEREHAWKLKHAKNPAKVGLEVGNSVQTQMRKHVENLVVGKDWEKDYKDITEEVMQVLLKR